MSDDRSADDAALEPLTPEAKAWMGAHAWEIAFFWKRTQDPTRYVNWNEVECRKHWPEFWTLWRQYLRAEAALNRHCDNAIGRYSK